MRTIIDSHLLNDFFTNRPYEINTDKEIEKLIEWTLFRDFIKTKTNLLIADHSHLNANIWQLLTYGRGDTMITKLENKINTHKGIISGEFDPATFFCLKEPEKEKRIKIRSKNGYVIAFEDDYYSKWIELSFKNRGTLIPIDKNNVDSLKSWNDINQFILPFTDLIISDSYVLSDISLINSNLYTLWETLDSLTPVKYNFLIVTYEGNPKMDIKKEFVKINEFKIKRNLKANLSLVFTSIIDKEHDRNIFMNYIRLKSGDSFNYFDSRKKIITKGTEIDIYPCTEPQKEKATQSILKRLKVVINNASKGNMISSNEGKVFNRLLNF